jgi:hypothetical protein
MRSSLVSKLFVVAIGLAISASPALANQKATSITSGSLTQTHTLFFSTTLCTSDGQQYTGYAFQSWNTRFQRVSGADREISQARYRTADFGIGCTSGQIANQDTGERTYYPNFGTRNDVTWTLQLGWPMVYPLNLVVGSAGSSHKGYYSRRSGGAAVQTICTNVNLTNNYDFSSEL